MKLFRFGVSVGAVVLLVLFTTMGFAQTQTMPGEGHAMDQPQHGMTTNVADDKFGPLPGVPSCMTGAIQHGDPMNPNFVVLLKATAGCTVPWHWHSANEQLMFVSGSAQFQAKGDQVKTMSAGGYVYGPAKHPHTVTCSSECMMYLTSDGPFDIHYVDKAGNEIPADQAMASAK